MDIHFAWIDHNYIVVYLVEFPNLREKGFRREFLIINAFVNHMNIIYSSLASFLTSKVTYSSSPYSSFLYTIAILFNTSHTVLRPIISPCNLHVNISLLAKTDSSHTSYN